MGFKVAFKFDITEKVLTPFGDYGIIDMAGVDDSCHNKYYVKMANSSAWLREDQLSRPETPDN